MTRPIAAGGEAALAAAGRHLGVALTAADVDRALARASLAPARELRRLTGGNVNSLLLADLADGSRRVLKLGHPVFRPGKLLNEARALASFRSLGLPVPTPHGAEARGETLPVDWLVMDYVEGEPLAAALAGDGPQAEALAGDFGALLAGIFAAPPGDAFGAVGDGGRAAPIPWLALANPGTPQGPFATFDAWLQAEVREQLAGVARDARFAEAAGPLANAILRLGRRCAGLRPGLVHGDFTAANVLVRAAQAGGLEIAAVLDCEWSHYGARELELLWAERSLARALHPARRETGLASFRRRLPGWRPAPPELASLAEAILQLYEMNAFGWISAGWPAERVEREARERREIAWEICSREAP